MIRPLLPIEKNTVRALEAIYHFHHDVVEEVSAAVAEDDVVVVGMKNNPFVQKTRKALTSAGISYTYLGYGSYFSQWKERLAIKLWSGWPTYPQIFVHGTLIGGDSDLKTMMEAGSLQVLLDAGGTS